MKPTGSQFELAQRCPGAFTLPQSRRSNAFALAGIDRHAADEAAINRGEVPDDLSERWPGYTWRAEVAFAYDVATGEARELGQGLSRDYGSLGTFEYAGTADKVGRNGDSVIIIDKKSFDEVTPAERNPQVRFLGLAATRAYNAKHTEIGITHELRPLDVAVLTPFDFDAIHDDVRTVVLEIARVRKDARDGKPVQFVTGRQCRWCNAFDDCPKQKELRALVVNGEMSVRVEAAMPYQSDDEAAIAYDLMKKIGILHKRIKESLIARAKERPIPIGGGKFYGINPRPGNEELDGDVAYRLLRDKHGQDVADKACTRETTKKAVKEALKTIAPHGMLAEMERKFLDELREAGGVGRKATKMEPVEFVPMLKAVNE